MRRRAVLMGGPALLAAASSLVLYLGVFDAPQASGSVRLPVSVQMEHQLIISAHVWLFGEGDSVSADNLSIVTGQSSAGTAEGPLAAFVAEDRHYYGSACLTLHGPVPTPAARPGDLVPSPLSQWPQCVLFSKSSPSNTWVVRYTQNSNCGNIGVVLRGLWGPWIPVCRLRPAVYPL